MPIDGLSNKQIDRLIRNDINNIKNSIATKNNAYSISENNFKYKLSAFKQMSKIVLN